jgi:peptidoglycan/LPS O-acetylase OafA/YrhL
VYMSPWAAAAGLLVPVMSLTIPEGRWVRLCLLYLAGAIIISAAFKFRQDSHAFDFPADGPRYFYVPQLVLVWCAISLCFSRSAGIISGAAALVTLALTYPHEFFSRPQLPDEHWAEHVKNIGKMLVVIPVNPPGWSVTVPEPESVWSTQ